MNKISLAIAISLGMSSVAIASDWNVETTTEGKKVAVSNTVEGKTQGVFFHMDSDGTLIVNTKATGMSCMMDEPKASVVTYNDQAVKVTIKCSEEGNMEMSPVSDAGLEFLNNELLKKKGVTINTKRGHTGYISAEGYTAAMSEVGQDEFSEEVAL
ncbi:hypothetical protein [Vibrio superstes]|uniref:DUF306 domain-containing protein n=1 Tax=Vibrio superstes NBRC 103154 TaxID=1219062 RepID=A0A511QL93_9VIBR|nr:hypothetical protein [Vibrio superstes]GEM78095.1 hypothetical protein VSU01S_03400 [Vibrio superstes NBRC 103154]